MSKTYPELPGWTFHVDEVSAGVYDVIGTDGFGHRVASKGIDPDAVLKDCRDWAARIARIAN